MKNRKDDLIAYEDRGILELALVYWQDAFRMRDWDISIKYVSRSEFLERERAGEAEIDSQHRKAIIKVVDEREIATSEHPDWTLDRKLVLAHEFAHILLWGAAIPDPHSNPVEFQVFEQTIHAIATGISEITNWQFLRRSWKSLQRGGVRVKG